MALNLTLTQSLGGAITIWRTADTRAAPYNQRCRWCRRYPKIWTHGRIYYTHAV